MGRRLDGRGRDVESIYRAFLKYRPSGCYQVKMWRHRLHDVIDVCTIDQSGGTITPKINGPSDDRMIGANLAL